MAMNLASPTSATVVAGEAEESDEEQEEPPKTSQPRPRLEEAKASLAGLSLSSVTATVERTIGSLPGLELGRRASQSNGPKKSPTAEDQLTAPPVHPSLLHKRLYERNGEVQANLHTFFQDLFCRNQKQLEDIFDSSTLTQEYLQETACTLQRSLHQVNQLEGRLGALKETLDTSKLPPLPPSDEGVQ